LAEIYKHMIKLHQIRKHPKSTHRRKVVGRGLGSGKGTYSGRGAKGQKARTGHSKMPAGFEGGRQPLMRQVPKSRGFRALTAKAVTVPLNELSVFNDGDTVNAKSLQSKGVIKVMAGQALPRIKIVGGEIKKKLFVRVPASGSAKAAIEKAGGSVVLRK
jgi:large subunit ribosomal protein L15